MFNYINYFQIIWVFYFVNINYHIYTNIYLLINYLLTKMLSSSNLCIHILCTVFEPLGPVLLPSSYKLIYIGQYKPKDEQPNLLFWLV